MVLNKFKGVEMLLKNDCLKYLHFQCCFFSFWVIWTLVAWCVDLNDMMFAKNPAQDIIVNVMITKHMNSLNDISLLTSIKGECHFVHTL